MHLHLHASAAVLKPSSNVFTLQMTRGLHHVRSLDWHHMGSKVLEVRGRGSGFGSVLTPKPVLLGHMKALK